MGDNPAGTLGVLPLPDSNDPVLVALIDDEKAILGLYQRVLDSNGYKTLTYSNVSDALKGLSAVTVDVIISDVSMPGRTGLDALQDYQKLPGEPEVIFITAFGDVPEAVKAARQGAYDYIMKPFDTDRLLIVLQRAAEHVRLRRKAIELERGGSNVASILLGQSPAVEEIRGLVEVAGPTDAPVLITGESGTGKELIARSLHDRSKRSKAPFVVANCSAFTETLFEAELFGHEKGAFTGADRAHAGLFETANEGTLFLDEIGELPLPMQAKLLRALQEGEVRRVGSSQTRKVDVRIIAATNRVLEKEVKEKRFREDLFYRLNVIRIEVPPLRSRPGDAELLAGIFLSQFARKYQKPAEQFSPEARQFLLTHGWPGNIRELKNAVERAIVLSRGPNVEFSGTVRVPLPGAAGGTGPAAAEDLDGPYQDVKDRHIGRITQAYLEHVMAKAGNSMTKAAEIAGMDRSNFRRLYQKFQSGSSIADEEPSGDGPAG